VFAVETTVQVVPDKSFYRPNDPVRIAITASNGKSIRARVMYLNQAVTVIDAPITNGQAEIVWTPPPTAPRGYGLVIEVLGEDNAVLGTQSSAFDVLERWTDAPRYGFLSDFTSGRNNDAETGDWLLRHHINGLQFYDWQYRWEDLLPDTDEFQDGLGRPQSMATIRRLIDLAHSRNVAAMPYSAIYGASIEFYREHPSWAFFNALNEPFLFGDNFIAIMNPAPGSRWNEHLLGEFADVLDHTAFDGIHIDQYGSPKNGFDEAGNPIDLAEVMPQFVNQTAELVQEQRGDDGVVLFNCVGNWPIDVIAPSQVDASYIEVWSPYNDYIDLNRIITNAQAWGAGKPVILAAYISPAWTINWRLANAVIFASGGSHIETGEPGTMLADPYFPRFEMIDEAQQALFQRYYDFLVRYENVLAINTAAGSYGQHSDVDLGDVRTGGIRAKNRVVPIVRTGDGFDTVSLINFIGIDGSDWNAPTNVPPTPLNDLPVSIQVSRPVRDVWAASPDDAAAMNAESIPFTVENGVLQFRLARLDYWSMIVVEYDNGR
jgi:dextranase